MKSVEFRWHNGKLEFRCLIILERELYSEGEPGGTELYIDWRNQYSDWEEVPSGPERV